MLGFSIFIIVSYVTDPLVPEKNSIIDIADLKHTRRHGVRVFW